jgi:hypothetical protein
MIVVGTTTATGRVTATAFEATTAGITATIAMITTVAGLIQMAITIFAITSPDVICVLASTREPMIMHPMKAIAAWNMTLPTARQV